MVSNNNPSCSECFLSETDDLFSGKTICEFQENEILIEQGKPFKGVICIKKGDVKIFKTNKKQNEFIFWHAQPGDMLGLDAFIDNENYSFSAIATQAVKACVISGQDLNNMIKCQPTVSIRLMKELCKKILLIENRVTSIIQKEVKEQLAELLLSFSKKSEDRNKIALVNYSIKDLANTIGTTKNYIYKILSDFSKYKIIAVENKKIKITDPEKLSKIASGN